MNKSNFEIGSELLADNFNSYLKNISSISIELIDVLNKYYTKSNIVVDNTTYNSINENSSNNVIKTFLDKSFIDFVMKVYLNPSLDGSNYVIQDYNIDKIFDLNVNWIRLNKYYYNLSNEKTTNAAYLYAFDNKYFKINENNRLLEHNSNVVNYNTYIGQTENVSGGWGKTLRTPRFNVTYGHINDTTNYKLEEVIIKTPTPYKNVIFNRTIDYIGNGYNIPINNLLSIDVTIYFARSNCSNYNPSYTIKKDALERGVKIYSFRKAITFIYSNSILTMSYESFYSDTLNPEILITATVS